MAIVLPITSLFAGLHTIYFAIISFRVGIYRGQNIPKGNNYEQTDEFKFRNAAQSNFGQYFPVTMLLLGLLEANEVISQEYLLSVASIITALRLGHTLQLAFPKQVPMIFRLVGFLGTLASFIASGALCTLIGLQELGVVDPNLLGNNRSWFGFADEKYTQATDSVKSGWNTVKHKAQEL